MLLTGLRASLLPEMNLGLQAGKLLASTRPYDVLFTAVRVVSRASAPFLASPNAHLRGTYRLVRCEPESTANGANNYKLGLHARKLTYLRSGSSAYTLTI